MRIVLTTFAAACALLPASAIAAEPDSETRRAAEELRDPVRQAQIAATAEAVTEAMLSIPVAPLARAVAEVEGENPDYVDPDLRAGDFVDPDTIGASYEFAHRLPQMMGALAGVAVALEEMLPELRARIEAARPYDYDYDYDYEYDY